MARKESNLTKQELEDMISQLKEKLKEALKKNKDLDLSETDAKFIMMKKENANYLISLDGKHWKNLGKDRAMAVFKAKEALILDIFNKL